VKGTDYPPGSDHEEPSSDVSDLMSYATHEGVEAMGSIDYEFALKQGRRARRSRAPRQVPRLRWVAVAAVSVLALSFGLNLLLRDPDPGIADPAEEMYFLVMDLVASPTSISEVGWASVE